MIVGFRDPPISYRHLHSSDYTINYELHRNVAPTITGLTAHLRPGAHRPTGQPAEL
jgi:hypothetical protein